MQKIQKEFPFALFVGKQTPTQISGKEQVTLYGPPPISGEQGIVLLPYLNRL